MFIENNKIMKRKYYLNNSGILTEEALTTCMTIGFQSQFYFNNQKGNKVNLKINKDFLQILVK